MSSSNPTASGVLSVSDSSPTYLRDHASSVTAPTKDEIRLKKEALESLYESAERALSSLDRSAVESIRTQIGDELEVIGEMYSRRIQSLPKGEEREWLKSERKNAILNFDEFETHVEETLTRHLGTVTTTDQIASAEGVMSRPASFRASNPYLRKLKSNESKSRSESHRSFSTTASEQGRRQAKIEKKLAQLELEAVERQNKLELESVERQNKLEAVERQNKLELEAVERRNKLEQRRLAAEIELRKAETVDQILNDKESYRSRSARSGCKTSIPDDDRPVSAPNNLAATNDVLNFKRSACLQPSIVQMPTRSQIRTPLSQPVSVSEEQANLSHKGNDCSPLAAVVEYMSMPKLECPKFHGDPEDYCAFFRYFNENIHDKNIFSDQQKLAYLLQNTYGKAYDAISHCPSLQPASKGYEEARYILFESFGDPRIIAESFKRSLLQRSNVKPHNGSSMASYANALRKGLVTLEDLGDYSELNTVDCLKRLSDKLPQAVSYHWRRHYAKIYLEEKRKPTFSDFVTYVKREADILKAFPEQFLVSANDQTERRRVNEGGVRKNICATTTVSQSNAPSRFPRKGVSFSRSKELPAQQCYYCSKPDHLVYKCNDFLELSVAERERFVQESQRCHICFAKHATKDHRGSFRCRINNCGRRHNRLLHANTSALDNTSRQDEPRGTDETISGETCCYVNQSQRGFRVIVPVEVEARGVTVQTYAFLDTGSETSFIDKDLFSRLRIQESPRPVNIVTISQHSEPFEKYSVNLTVSSLMDDSVNFKIREVVKADALPVSPNAVVSLNDLLSLPHLQGVTIPKMNQDKVSLLIGLDCPNAHRILEMREGDGTQPNAVKTPFGWSLLGPAINRTEGNQDMQTYFVQSDEALDHEIRKSWFTEFEPDVINAPSSKEDREVATLLKNGVTHENGHFCAPLPWRSDVKLPRNSRFMASKRLSCLQKRLQRDSQLMAKYKETIEGYIESGYAERVPIDEIAMDDSAWYLPHHPVYNPKKRDKVRIVFDCAAKHYGICLNDALKQGPDLVNGLVGVLSRFRRERIAIVADVQAMFHQVKTTHQDHNAFRFLWWPEGDLHKQPVPYRMLVHIFGATSSPCIATYCLKETANRFGGEFDPRICDVIQKDFYVDDCLTCVSTVEQAKNTVEGLRRLLKLGGFNLTKWLSNVPEAVESVPEIERAPTMSNVSLEIDGSAGQKVLGVQWNVLEDEFHFNVKMPEHDRRFTRRMILSYVNSLYDPLGFVAPVILIARIMQQRIVQMNLDWDDELPDEENEHWWSWFQQLDDLRKFSLPRCFLSKALGPITDYQIHHFSDASISGYGFVSYLRIADINGKIHCSFLCGKARVTPLESHSVPRLELVAAVMAVQADKWLTKQLDLPKCRSTFWTDSCIVLGSIRNDRKRFKTFVANRLAKIHRHTSAEQWKYVDTKSNPADDASRGLSPSQLLVSRWPKGPSFLWENEGSWPRPPEAAAPFKGQLPDDFHFVENKQVAVSRVQETCGTVDDLIVRFSSLYRLKVACAWHRRFIAFLKDKSSVRKGGITVDELEAAELRLVAYVQRQVFGPVFKILESEVRLPNKVIKRELKENSQLRCLYKTSPILFEGLLRVGGRLEYATIDFSAKHPAILPYQHHLTNLLIRYHHVKCGHSGTSFTWTSIRQKYWILKGGAAVRRELNQCVICRKRSVPRGQQQMADLPRSRLVSNEPPFLYVGIDYFGPILVKRARSQLKRYGCVISCLTTRAVHIEVADDMTTDCFINAFRRFIARRGHPKEVFSDNGTNFKGAESILRKELSRLNQSKMDEYFKQTGIKWNFNPPAASHMGGAWERMIRSIRRILDILLKSQVVTDDVLHTLLLEVESILNSRPLCPITLDPHGNEPLTPNHLLLMRQSCNDPPGVFESRDCYGRRRWRQVQYLADSFWKRWRREYLPTIALRQKWPDKERNFQNGDLVLVVDDGVPRGKWRMGQVISTFPDPNGVVRQVEVKTGVSVLRRPIVKLCLICESNQASTNGPSVSDQ